LKVVYHLLSEAEHRWNYTRQQLDAAHVEVDSCTHVIMHLEHANEQLDLELKERVVMIATIEQQVQAPPTTADLAEPEAVSDVDKE
jgi:hypothetical protein